MLTEIINNVIIYKTIMFMLWKYLINIRFFDSCMDFKKIDKYILEFVQINNIKKSSSMIMLAVAQNWEKIRLLPFSMTPSQHIYDNFSFSLLWILNDVIEIVNIYELFS